jgi:hypothetical protein
MDERERKLLELRQAAEGHLIERAWSDPPFRARLLRDPKLTLSQELGIEFPEGSELEVLEETNTKKYLVLPEPLTADLSDEALENVTGGLHTPDLVSGVSTPTLPKREPVSLRQQVLEVESLYNFGPFGRRR